MQSLEVLVSEAKKEEKKMPSVSGCSRLNINAVINAQNPCEMVMVVSTSVNTESTWTLYKKLEALNPEVKNIYVISDNTRYYKING
ncbi:MAG: hypothetical protein OHK0057_04520 [Thermoflexibacter sp.]